MDPLTFTSNDYGRWLVVLAAIGMLVGFAWVHRISSIREDPDRSFSRLSGQRGGGSRLPDAPDVPTRGWLLTRGAILIGVGSVVFALVGPQVMRRWNPAFEAGGIAIVMWMLAVLAAAVGTAWMIRIAIRAADDDAPAWRSRR
jgi:hypothetical protein